MPFFWRILIYRYLKKIFYCSLGTVSVVIISSLQELANLIAKKVPLGIIIKLILYQIPYLLPLIIPVSCFISSLSLFRHLSENNQLTFLRSAGGSLSLILSPLLWASSFICIINFYVCSELSSICRSKSCKEIANIVMDSPSFLLQTFQKTEGHVFINIEGQEKNLLKNLIVFLKKPPENNFELCVIKDIHLKNTENSLKAENVTIFSKIPSSKGGTNMLIENIKEVFLSKLTFFLINHSKTNKVRQDYFSWKELKLSPSSHRLAEIVRRVATGILCFTLTFSGASLGISRSRFKRKRNFLFFIPPSISFILLIIGKNIASDCLNSIIFFILPQCLTLLIFWFKLQQEKILAV